MFTRFRGKTKLMHFKKTDTAVGASLKAGSLVSLSDSGAAVHYAKNDSTDRIIGVSRLTIAATDTSTWAGAPFVPVEVPVEDAVEWIVDTDSDAGAADTDIGRYCTIDTTGGNNNADCEAASVDINDTAQRLFITTAIISASKVVGVIARSAFHQRPFDTTDN